MFDEIIADCKGYIERDGFVYTTVTYPANVYDALYIRNIKNNEIRFRNFPSINTTLEEHIALIKRFKLEKANVFASNLDFLREVPFLKHLFITLYYGEGYVDYAPLYEMPLVKSLTINNSNFKNLEMPVDYSKIKGLEELTISEGGHFHYEAIDSLKSLSIGSWKKKDLKELFTSKKLDTLRMIECKMHSLDGIEQSEKMQCLYLHYNYSLEDISMLAKLKKTLKALRIENCPKIKDFSVLSELENLELLELTGNNTLPDLQFLKQMKNLKTFIFDMNVLDGDLTLCLDLSYVYLGKNRRHYNVKEKDMPKGEYVRGNENIEAWRKME